jgi:hypothetical protein
LLPLIAMIFLMRGVSLDARCYFFFFFFFVVFFLAVFFFAVFFFFFAGITDLLS